MASETIHIITTLVFPGGVAEKDIAGDRRMVRVALGNIEDPDYGLLAEVEGKNAKIPWETKEAREEAIAALRTSAAIDCERKRAELIRHVTLAQYFDRKSQ